MKKLIIASLIATLLSPAAIGQVKILKDRFDFSNVAFDIILENEGSEVIYLDSLNVFYDWVNLDRRAPVPDPYFASSYTAKGLVPASYNSGGLQWIVKPIATFSVSVPPFGSGVVLNAFNDKIPLRPRQPARMTVGLEIVFEEGWITDQLESKLQLHFTQQTVKTHARILGREYLISKREIPIELQKGLYSSWETAVPFEEQTYPCLAVLNNLEQLQASSDYFSPVSYQALTYELKWLYTRRHAEDSIKRVYNLAIDHRDSVIRLHALTGIRLLMYTEYQTKLENLLRRTNSREEARACAEALYDFEDDYRSILANRLSDPSTSSSIRGFCAMELLKLGYDGLPPLVLNQLANEKLADEDYHRMVLAFQLSQNSSYRDKLYALIHEKRAWAYSSNKSLDYKFSQLILPALYGSESYYFVPLIKDILATGRAGSNTLKTFLFHAKQINQLNARNTNAQSDPSVFWDNIVISRSLGPDQTFHSLHGDSIQANFENDSRFRQNDFFYTCPGVDWIDALVEVFPKYKDCQSPWIRRHIFLLTNACNPYSGGKKIDAYCHYLDDNGAAYLKQGLNSYSQLSKEDIGAFLGYLEFFDAEGRGAMYKEQVGAIFQNYPDPDVRYLAFDLILKNFWQLDQYLAIALRDPSTSIRELAESALYSIHYPGLERVVLDNLKKVSGDQIDRSIKAYTSYLGHKAYPVIKEIIMDGATPPDLLFAHVNNIAENIPADSLSVFKRELKHLFSNPENSRLRPTILRSFIQYMTPDELIPYLNTTFGTPVGSSLEIDQPVESLLAYRGILPLIEDFLATKTKTPGEKAIILGITLKVKEKITPYLPEEEKYSASSLGMDYWNLAWYYFYAKEFDKAENVAKRGFEMDPSRDYLTRIYALSLLYQGKFEEARSIYLKYKDQKNTGGELFRNVFLRDFNDLKNAGISHSDIEKVKELLRKE